MVHPSGEFGAHDCPVRAFRYYHRLRRDHPKLCNGKPRLFIVIEDNNYEKMLCAASMYRWICDTIVESHAAFDKSKSLPKTVKAHEVRSVTTSLQLFSEIDLQTVMKAGRWLSGRTFTSFCLQDLCPQADCLHNVGPMVVSGRVVAFTSASSTGW